MGLTFREGIREGVASHGEFVLYFGMRTDGCVCQSSSELVDSSVLRLAYPNEVVHGEQYLDIPLTTYLRMVSSHGAGHFHCDWRC